MAELPIMPWFADAYMADTRHLSLEEDGAYRRLLDIAWRSAHNALPDDDKRIAMMLGISPKRWARLKPVVMAFWTLTSRGWQQKKLTETFRAAQKKSRKCSQAANTRWKSKSLENNDLDDADADANAYAEGYPTINHNHEPTLGDKSPNNNGAENFAVPQPEWSEYARYRKRIGKPLTEHAVKLATAKLEKLAGEGSDPREVLNQSVMNGWTGLFPIREHGAMNGRSETDRTTAGAASAFGDPRQWSDDRPL